MKCFKDLKPKSCDIRAGFWLLCLFALSALPAGAQTNLAKPKLPSNRYLLVVDTSHSMGRRSEATLRTVYSLFQYGMRGQIHSGDSVGLWTYNEEVYTGRFPLQTWTVGAGQQAI